MHRKKLFILIAVMLLISSSRPIVTTAANRQRVQRGAPVPYIELEAEDAATNGTIIEPSRKLTALAAEASGRRAVTLGTEGQYVEFTLPAQANSVVVRYSIPDSADGAGLTAPLSLYIDGARQPDLVLTSKYSWVYGVYPFRNTPSLGRPHHFFDEVRALLPQINAGSKVRLQKDATSTAASYTIDLVDFEQVAPPKDQPAGTLSVADYGADPTGATDATTALQKAVDDGKRQGKPVWIPPGTYTVTSHIIVDNVTVLGAGMWHSVLRGAGVGVYGRQGAATSKNVKLSDFAIFGEVMDRDDQAELNGVGGTLSDTTIENLWIEHTKVGIWVNGPLSNLTITGLRIRNTMADGVNFHRGVSNSTVQQSHIRNTGDDGLAMWAEIDANTGNVFQFNTVQLPNLANNIAIYGGSDNKVIGNIVTDTLWNGGGIHVGNRFKAVGVGGTTIVDDNLLIRTGSYHTDAQLGIGAIWFYAADSAMSGTITLNNNEINDSSYAAILFVGLEISNVTFNGATINRTGTFGVQIQSPGSAALNNVTATGVQAANVYKCDQFAFTITATPNDSLWSAAQYCGARPTPAYPMVIPSPTP
jgi:hypothetical protein